VTDPSQLPVHSDANLALLIGGVMGALRLAERLAEKWLASGRKSAPVVYRLDDDASDAIRLILERTQRIHEAVTARDEQGHPRTWFQPTDIEDAADGVRSHVEAHAERLGQKIDSLKR
jgi:hypothetical protein